MSGLDALRIEDLPVDARLRLILGARVRVTEARRAALTPGTPSRAGREGVVERVSSIGGRASDGGWWYVRLDPAPRERVERIELFPGEHLELLPSAPMAKKKQAEPEKPKRGRPVGSGMPGAKRRSVYLDEATWEELARLGTELGAALGGGDGRSAAIRHLVTLHAVDRGNDRR